ncbi:MAG TPA: hypothetical protein PLP17_10465, partial [Oligoflexia bacterium]|nr:hypothetical protein [Oligoflexia bacterium]
RICRGVALKDGSAKARSARTLRESARILRLLGGLRAGESYLELIAGEGRKHFVKRILSAVGHPVVKLCRVRFGPYLLGELAPGEIREVRNYRK